ncbi:MAG: [FeFe] hydrogenase H-cluster radical SAM maturase HydE [Pseudomonadota bacterium]
MCIALPAKIIKIKNNQAWVEPFSGNLKEIDCSLYPEAKPGDYFLAYGGRALKILKDNEAEEMLKLLHEVQKRTQFFEIIKKGKLNTADVRYLLNLEDPQDLYLLYSEADRLREVFLKKSVCVHGVIEFSNYCESNCAYCGLACSNQTLPRYRMSAQEIIETACDAVARLGFKMIVLQSGEDYYYDDQTIIEIIKGIKKGKPVLIFLSIGERGFEAYQKFRKAGAKGILFRFETSDHKLYKKLHPDSELETRLEHIKFMKELGYLVASGPLVGLPGQNQESIINDILLMRDLKVDMASIGTFVPHHQTALGQAEPGSQELTKKVIAATRLTLSPNLRIPIATSLETVSQGAARSEILQSGGNSLMLNLTPNEYRRHYSIYPERFGEKETVEDLVNESKRLVSGLGRRVCRGWGAKLKVQENSDEFLPLCN